MATYTILQTLNNPNGGSKRTLGGARSRVDARALLARLSDDWIARMQPNARRQQHDLDTVRLYADDIHISTMEVKRQAR